MATKGKSKVMQKNRKAAVMAGPAARARAGAAASRRKAVPAVARKPPRRAAVVRQPSMSERSYAIGPKPVA